MADVLIIQADAEARSMLGHVLEEDGYEVACASNAVAALAALYLNPRPLIVIVDDASVQADPATLDLIAADLGRLGRHRYIVQAGSQLADVLMLAESPLPILHCHIMRKPVTPAQIRELVAHYVARLPALPLDVLTMMDAGGHQSAAQVGCGRRPSGRANG